MIPFKLIRPIRTQALFRKSFNLLWISLLILSGCNGDSSGYSVSPDPDESGLTLAAPIKIRESLAIDFSQVTGVANVNGRTYEMVQSGSSYRAAIDNIPVNSDVQLNLLFQERLPSGQTLRLAYTDQINIAVGTTNQTRQILQAEYLYDYDADGDGVSNIVERTNGSDPFTPENAVNRVVVVQLNIPQIINDPSITQVIALFADVPRARSRPFANTFSFRGEVSSRIPVGIDIRLTQEYQGQKIIVARALTERPPGVEDIFIALTDNDFDFSLDSDGDGISNLDELQAGTNPVGT